MIKAMLTIRRWAMKTVKERTGSRRDNDRNVNALRRNNGDTKTQEHMGSKTVGRPLRSRRPKVMQEHTGSKTTIMATKVFDDQRQ
jgi:hypothetical protein